MKITAILGLFVAILPFLGIPIFWKTIIFVILGITIFGQSFCRRKNIGSVSNDSQTARNNVFVENDDCSNGEKQ